MTPDQQGQLPENMSLEEKGAHIEKWATAIRTYLTDTRLMQIDFEKVKENIAALKTYGGWLSS